MKTYKEFLNEIEEKIDGSVRARKTGTVLSKGTKELARRYIQHPEDNRRMNNVRDKETDEHYETHFDSDHEEGLITRVHKKTGKVEHNYGIEQKLPHRVKGVGRVEGWSRFKKNPNGEFKPSGTKSVTTLKENEDETRAKHLRRVKGFLGNMGDNHGS